MEMSALNAGPEMPAPPCKGMAPDCTKHLCCVTVNLLPAGLPSHATAVEYSTVGYWASVSKLAGVQREPDHLPPRTA